MPPNHLIIDMITFVWKVLCVVRQMRERTSFVGGLLAGCLLAYWHHTWSVPAPAPAVLHQPTLQYAAESPPPPPMPPPPRRLSSHSSALAPAVRGVFTPARTRGPYYGDIDAPGEFERCVRTVSHDGEIVVLHGDAKRLRMLVNLIANLNEVGIYHILLLGFNEETCVQLAKRGRIGCAHSSYLWDLRAPGESGELAAARARWTLAPRYVAWIQKFHLMQPPLHF